MATEAHKFQVGIFVIGATIIAVAAAIWLGASRYFEDEIYMLTYFSESVQGLDPGSAVKYRGVPAGRVEQIKIAPDGHLIEVLMSIKSELADSVREDEALRAQLQLLGITGLRYVEINRHSGDALAKSPELSFKPAYPLIKSTPSSFVAVQEALADIYGRVMSVDIEGISADARATLQAADQLLRDERVHRVLTNMEEVSESASRVTRNVERMTAGVELGPAVTELRETTAAARGVFSDLRGGETGRQLRSTLKEIDGLARTTQEFVIGLQVTMDRLNRTAGNLEQLSNELSKHPSRLLFSEPPPPRGPGDEVRR